MDLLYTVGFAEVFLPPCSVIRVGIFRTYLPHGMLESFELVVLVLRSKRMTLSAAEIIRLRLQ